MEKILKPFGKYFLLDRIAHGGMADIFRARPATVDAGNRLLAIKCLRSKIAEEKQFIEMFRSEVKITLALSHPNIVQHYDFGDGADTQLDGERRPFLAMEFIHGRSLRALLNHLRKADARPRLDVIVHVLDQVARGLHYAHEFRDPISNMPLYIIHRDINPANILLSFDGTVKLIDFGVAKAAVMSEATESGVIKGTPSYLSPEQVMGSRSIDRRSDIFNLGIVLWESLTGKRLFKQADDREMIIMIERCDSTVSPPSVANPQAPKELDAITMKALSHDPEKRFATAEEFRLALAEAARRIGADETRISAAGTVRQYLGGIWAAEEKAELRQIRQLNEEAERILTDMAESEAEAEEARSAEAAFSSTLVLDAQSAARGDTMILPASQPAAPPAGIPPRPGGPGAQRVDIAVSGDARKAVVTIDETPIARFRSRGGTDTIRSGRRYVMRKSTERQESSGIFGFLTMLGLGMSAAYGVYSYLGNFTGGGFGASQTGAKASPEPDEGGADAAPIHLTLQITPPGQNTLVKVNGRTAPVQDLTTVRIDVPSNQQLDVVVGRPSYAVFSRSIAAPDLAPDPQGNLQMEVKLVPNRYGLLTISTVVSGEARIVVDGSPWVWKTPIENEKVPVGAYTLQLINPVLGVRRAVPLTVVEGKAIKIVEDLSRDSR